MGSNLFEQDNGFRLVDVDGRFLSNANDFINIREPVGFADVKIILERGKKSHGFNYEFGEEEKTYGFDRVTQENEQYSPYELISGLFDLDQYDSNCVLEYRENGTLEFSGRLDFEEYKKFDDVINIRIRRVNFDDLLRTRFDTLIKSSESSSIDGSSITAPSSQEMFLHGRKRVLNCKSSTDQINFYQGIISPVIIDQTQYLLTLEFDNIEYINGDKSFIEILSGNNGFFLESFFPSPTFPGWAAFQSYNAMNVERYSYKVKMRTTVNVVIDTNGGIGAGVSFEIGHGWVDFDADTLSLPVDPNKIAVLSNTDDVVVPDNTTTTVNLIIENDFFVSSNDEVGKKAYLLFRGSNLTSQAVLFTVTSHEVSFVQAVENSVCRVYDPLDVVNHCLAAIIGENDLVRGSLLQSQLDEIYLSNGYKIRRFDESEISSELNVNTDLEYSFKSLFEGWIKPFFGAGYQVYDDNGTLKILIDRYSVFYQDNEIDFIESVIDESFEITVDKNVIFNQIEVGYKKFPSSNDENKDQNLDEFNTLHISITDIKRVKKTLKEISDFISAGYKIENQRREQFRENVSKTVSDDEEIFTILGLSINSYNIPFPNDNSRNAQFRGTILGEVFNYLRIPNTYYDIRRGDTITVSGFDASVDGNYEILGVVIADDVMFLTIPSPPVNLLTKLSDFTILLNRSSLVAERDDKVSTLNNVFSPETVYNVGLNPKNILYNHSPIFKSGLIKKPSTSLVKNRSVKLNDQMIFEFETGEGGYILGNGYNSDVRMGRNILQSELADPLFTGEYVKWKSRIAYSRVKVIRDKCLNQSNTGNLGYVRVNDFDGREYKVFLMMMKYNPLTEKVEFEGRVKYDA